jgi:hypothetical protein
VRLGPVMNAGAVNGFLRSGPLAKRSSMMRTIWSCSTDTLSRRLYVHVRDAACRRQLLGEYERTLAMFEASTSISCFESYHLARSSP